MIEGLVRAWVIAGDEIERASKEIPNESMTAESMRTYLEMRRRMVRIRTEILKRVAEEEAKLKHAADV